MFNFNPVGRAKSNQAVTPLRQLSYFQHGTDLGHDCLRVAVAVFRRSVNNSGSAI